MLLLLFASQPGTLVAAAAVLTLTAPPATLVVDEAGTGIFLDATPCVLTLSAPPAAPAIVLQATPCVIALSAPVPTAAPEVSGTVTLNASPNVLTLSQGTAGISIDLTATAITINGTPRQAFIRPDSIGVTDNLDEAPNLATFIADGFVPIPGHEIVITVGSATNREFAGHLTAVEQVFEVENPVNVAYHCEAIDYTRLFDRRLVHQRYPAQSVTTTVQQVIATHCVGFTAGQVATSLPAIAEVEFDHEVPSRVLTRLAQLIGAYWYVDYNRVVHFFLTETADAPDPILSPNAGVRTLSRRRDNVQNRTQVFVTGQGTQTTVDLPAGVGTIPIDDATPFASGGGSARINAFQLAYTGRSIGGDVTTIKGAPPPTSAPAATIVSGAGGVEGLTNYRVAFKSEAGQTVPGPASNSVIGAAFPPPVGAPITAVVAAGIGKLAGAYNYKMTQVTVRGETAIGTSAATALFATAVAAPAPPSIATGGGAGLSQLLGVLVGAYGYKVAFVTPLGESLPSVIASRTALAFVVSGSPTTSGTQVSGTPGHLTAGGAYRWALSAVTPYGESLIGLVSSSSLTIATIAAPGAPGPLTVQAGGSIPTASTVAYAVAYVYEDGTTSAVGSISGFATPTVGNQTVRVQGIAVGPTGVIGRRLYRRTNADSRLGYVGQLENNLDTEFTDDLASRGATAPATGTIGGRVTVTIPVVAAGTAISSAILGRRIYRTKAGGSTYWLVGQQPDNVTTTWVDDVPDAALTVGAPPVSTAGGEQHDLTVPTGPAGTLARRIYRTPAGGTEVRLLAEIQDNVTTTWRDNATDAALGTDGPALVSTAGGQPVDVTVAAGTVGTIARRVYRTKAGGSVYFLDAQIVGNAFATYTDNTADEDLGDPAPDWNTAGASAVLVSSIPGGPTGTTARRLYRLDLDGAYRFVAELHDNTTTTFLDDLGDDDLGDVAPTESSIGAIEGASTLLVDDTAPFYAGAGGGWAFIGSMAIHYAAIVGDALVGIPSLEAPVRVEAEITAAPMLLGATALPYDVPKGSPVRILVMRESLSGQAAMAATEGGDGIHQHMVEDDLLTIASAITRADAELLQFATDEHRVTFSGRDPKWRSGKTISINIGPPTNIVGTFKIQQVVITEWGIPGTLPLRTVIASSVLYSFEHLLRRVELGA